VSVEYRLKVYPYEDGFEIAGNREGLKQLADICLDLAQLPEDNEEAKRLGNRYHFADYMNNLEDGSTPFIILYKPDL
jgi:hypothetical protein